MGTWLEETLDWGSLVRRGRAFILPADALVLVLREAVTLAKGEHSYLSARCLFLTDGDVFFVIRNALDRHDRNFERFA